MEAMSATLKMLDSPQPLQDTGHALDKLPFERALWIRIGDEPIPQAAVLIGILSREKRMTRRQSVPESVLAAFGFPLIRPGTAA
jgi:hypothetical protein